jgi:hypothetical protein
MPELSENYQEEENIVAITSTVQKEKVAAYAAAGINQSVSYN